MTIRKDKVMDDDKCPECGSRTIIHDDESGEVICGECGLVLREFTVNEGPEWRAFTQSEKETRSRVGIPISLTIHDQGLTTTIGRVSRDAMGRKIPLKMRLQMLRLRKWQTRARVHTSEDRNLSQAMAELDRLSDKLHIPQPVKEKAAFIYRRALDKGLVRGRSISAISAASLYAACRTTQTPRTLREISRHSPIDKRILPAATGFF